MLIPICFNPIISSTIEDSVVSIFTPSNAFFICCKVFSAFIIALIIFAHLYLKKSASGTLLDASISYNTILGILALLEFPIDFFIAFSPSLVMKYF